MINETILEPTEKRYKRFDFPQDRFLNCKTKSDGDNIYRLWAAVLKQAINDLHDFPARHPSNSLSWFLSTNEEATSLIWLCDVLDVSYYKVLSVNAGRIKSLLQ